MLTQSQNILFTYLKKNLHQYNIKSRFYKVVVVI